jgi:cAMP phosphodiesterase
VFPFLEEPVCVYSTPEILAGLCKHVFNDCVWPDFHRIEIPGGKGPALEYVEADPMVPFSVRGLRITLIPVTHIVPTVGVLVEDSDAAALFTSDTCHTDTIWQIAESTMKMKAIFADVSYPNELQALAEASGHMTPRILESALQKMHCHPPIYAVHLKPSFRTQVSQQLAQINHPGISVCAIGQEYVI